ncbi:MAG: Helix-turn-helix domain [Bacteroidota bacterium]|jgi:excisionase family DNA binding protein
MVIIQEMTKDDLKAMIDGCMTQAIAQVNDVGPKKEQLLTRKEAAEYLNISLGTLHTHTKGGRIRGQRIGSRLLYRKSDLDNSTTATNKSHI